MLSRGKELLDTGHELLFRNILEQPIHTWGRLTAHRKGHTSIIETRVDPKRRDVAHRVTVEGKGEVNLCLGELTVSKKIML